MNRYKEIDLQNWDRTQLYEFYRTFANPCFSITMKVEARNIYKFAKDKKESFFLICLYAILRASNKVPQVRQRILNGKPVEFERIAAATPIMTPRKIFNEVWCEYTDSFAEFKADAEPKIAAAKISPQPPIVEDGEDFICASCVPWLHFEAFTPAEYAFGQTIPILGWGKMLDGQIPICVKFNHCFLDGIFVAEFFDEIVRNFANPEVL